MSTHKRSRGARASRATDAFASVDPDLYFSDAAASRHGNERKAEQFRAAIRRALSRALGCEIGDPELDELALVDVLSGASGSYAAVFATQRHADIDELQRRLREAAPLFRRALAAGLSRKRVPQVCFYVVPSSSAEVHDG